MSRTSRFHLDEIGEIIDSLIVIWEICEPEEMANHVEYI